jgi:hypothetical protein
MWEWPLAVYANPQNWRQLDPQALVIDAATGRVAALNLGRGDGAKVALPFPIYPHSLKDLNFEATVEVVEVVEDV